MNAKQSMKKYIEKLVSKALPNDDIEDYGIPTYKCPEIRKLAVEQLHERLEMVLTEEIKHMKENEGLLEDKYLYINCEICSREIDVEEEDYENCDRCEVVCCSDCNIYRPDIFGMKEMEDKNGECWRNCEVCTDCDEEFEKADDEEKEKIIQDMKLKHNEPDSDDALSEEDSESDDE